MCFFLHLPKPTVSIQGIYLEYLTEDYMQEARSRWKPKVHKLAKQRGFVGLMAVAAFDVLRKDGA